eukprot:6257281-Amphidinium_carterae.1
MADAGRFDKRKLGKCSHDNARSNLFIAGVGFGSEGLPTKKFSSANTLSSSKPSYNGSARIASSVFSMAPKVFRKLQKSGPAS